VLYGDVQSVRPIHETRKTMAKATFAIELEDSEKRALSAGVPAKMMTACVKPYTEQLKALNATVTSVVEGKTVNLDAFSEALAAADELRAELEKLPESEEQIEALQILDDQQTVLREIDSIRNARQEG
jgi:hypothetical protein